jgi:hypothetical protein
MKKRNFLVVVGTTAAAVLLSSCGSSGPSASELVSQGCAAWRMDHTDAELAEMNGWEDLENAITFWSQAARTDGSYSDLSTAATQSLAWLKMDYEAQTAEVGANSAVFQNVQSAVAIMQGYCGTAE